MIAASSSQPKKYEINLPTTVKWLGRRGLWIIVYKVEPGTPVRKLKEFSKKKVSVLGVGDGDQRI